MALGGVGLRLVDLAQLYAAIARGGEAVAPHYRREPAPAKAGAAASRNPAEARRLLSEVAAWYVRDILCRALPPANAKAGQVCYKTGTSYGFRDAWSVGFDGRHTVAVWVGRADGAAVSGLTGRTSAAPLLFDAFTRLSLKRTPAPPPPAGVLRASSAELPPPLRRFREGAAPVEDASAASRGAAPAPRIAFPPDRAEIEVDDDAPTVVTAEGGALPLTWLLDGEPLASDPARHDTELPTGRRGFFRLSVIDAEGRTDRVAIRLR
jgi:penicillin-binding protein 1C